MFVVTAASAGQARASDGGEPAPPARVGRIGIVVQNIYTPDEVNACGGLLRLLRRSVNGLHTSTRDKVIRRELLVRPGDPYDPALLAETERNLRALGFLARVTVVPLDTLLDGTVNLEVRAQETWSLSAEATYARSSAGEQRWSVQLEDDNFLGRGTQISIGGGRDEDRHSVGLSYRDGHLLGTAWRLTASRAERSDGSAWLAALDRPFRATADPWGGESLFWRDERDARYYLSNAGPAGADPSRTASLYALIPTVERGARAAALWRVSGAREGRVWRVGVGAEWRELAYAVPAAGLLLSDGRVVDSAFLTADDTPLRRETGTVVWPYVAAQTVGRRWTTGSRLLRYGPVEDVPLDVACAVRAGLASRALGAQRESALVELTALDWSRVAGGLLLLRAEGHAALGAAAQREAALDVVAGWIGQRGAGTARLFAETAWADRLDGRDAFQLGLGRGVRTLAYDGMAGDRLVRWTAELGRTLRGELLGLVTVGVAAHYAGGVAWWRDEERGLGDARHETGVGLRLGTVRSASSDLARLDLSWPLDTGGAPMLTAVTGGYF